MISNIDLQRKDLEITESKKNSDELKKNFSENESAESSSEETDSEDELEESSNIAELIETPFVKKHLVDIADIKFAPKKFGIQPLKKNTCSIYFGELKNQDVIYKMAGLKSQEKSSITREKNYNKHILNEAIIMEKMQSSKHIAQFMGVGFKENFLGIVIKRYKTNLTNLLKESKNITEKQKLIWIKQIAEGLKHIHDREHLHCDLKCGNIFIDEFNNAKIGDFGAACLESYTPKKWEEIRGTYHYMPPELFKNSYNTTEEIPAKHTKASEIYNFGSILFQIVTGKKPFSNLSLAQVSVQKLGENPHAELPADCSPFFRKLISACWQDDPSKRPSTQWIIDEVTCELQKYKSLESSVSSQGMFSGSSSTSLSTSISTSAFISTPTPTSSAPPSIVTTLEQTEVEKQGINLRIG